MKDLIQLQEDVLKALDDFMTVLERLHDDIEALRRRVE